MKMGVVAALPEILPLVVGHLNGKTPGHSGEDIETGLSNLRS